MLPTSVLREQIHHCSSLFSRPLLGEDGWAQPIYSACWGGFDTAEGRVRCLCCCLGAGSTFMLINTRSKSHIWNLQWGEEQQVWPDMFPQIWALTHTYTLLFTHPTTKQGVVFITWEWDWRAWLAGNSQTVTAGHCDQALARKTMTMARPLLIWTRKYSHKIITFSFSIQYFPPIETPSCRYIVPLRFWGFYENFHLLPYCPSYQMAPESILRYSLFTL